MTATIDDARRLTLLTITRTAYRRREEARVAAVNAANRKRDPRIPRVRTVVGAWPLILTLIGMFLGTTGLAPLLNQGTITRKTAPLLTIDQWMFPAGMLALISIALLTYLEPLRARGLIYHGGWEARGYLIFAVIWIGFSLWQSIFGLHDLTSIELARSILGCLVMFSSGVWAVVLWRHGRVTDAQGFLLKHHDPLRGLIDKTDALQIYTALDTWWHQEAAHQIATQPQLCEEIGRLALSRLKDFGYSVKVPRNSTIIAQSPKSLWKEPRRTPDMWEG